MKKLLKVVCAIIVTTLALTGCNTGAAVTEASKAETTTADAAAATSAVPASSLSGEGETYCVIMSLGQLQFFDALKAGVGDSANEIGAKWYFAGPQEFVPDQIVQAIDQAVANGVTGIVLHGQTEETADAVNNAIAAGIPVICVNTDIPSDRLSFLGCNPYNAGYEMGENMVKLLEGKTGSIIVSSALSIAQPSALENLRGAKDAITKNPNLKVIEVDDTSDESVAAKNIGAALQANPDVIGIIGQQAYSAVGAATAVREAGKEGEITIIGRDRDTATLELIKNGEVAASYAQNSYVEGYIALQWLHAYANGNLKAINDYLSVGMNPLPKSVDSGSIIITKENAAQFEAPYVYEVTATN